MFSTHTAAAGWQRLGICLSGVLGMLAFFAAVSLAPHYCKAANAGEPIATSSVEKQHAKQISPQLLRSLEQETRALYSHLRKSLVEVQLDPNPVHILPTKLQAQFLRWERMWVVSHHFHAAPRPGHPPATVAIVPEKFAHQGKKSRLNPADQRRLANLAHKPVAQLFLMRHFLFEMHHADQPPPWKYIRLINQRLMLLHQGNKSSLPGLVVGSRHHILILGLLDLATAHGKVAVINYRGQRLEGTILGEDMSRNLSVVELPSADQLPAIPLARGKVGKNQMRLSLNPYSRKLQWNISVRNHPHAHRRPKPRNVAFKTDLMLSGRGELIGIQSGPRVFHVTRRNPVFREFVDTGVMRQQRFGVRYLVVTPGSPLRRENPLLGRHPAILVQQVFSHSPAKVAGIERGDLITSVNGIPISRLPEIMRDIHHNTHHIAVSIIRNHKNIKLSIDLGKIWDRHAKRHPVDRPHAQRH